MKKSDCEIFARLLREVALDRAMELKFVLGSWATKKLLAAILTEAGCPTGYWQMVNAGRDIVSIRRKHAPFRLSAEQELILDAIERRFGRKLGWRELLWGRRRIFECNNVD